MVTLRDSTTGRVKHFKRQVCSRLDLVRDGTLASFRMLRYQLGQLSGHRAANVFRHYLETCSEETQALNLACLSVLVNH